MTLEMENINLYEMCKEIERLGGTVLDMNTDCAVCAFPDSKLPFRCDRQHVVKGYYTIATAMCPSIGSCPAGAG